MTKIDEEACEYPFGPPDRLSIEPRLAGLRAEHPVLRVHMPYGGDAWLVTRYADVKTVLADPRFSRAVPAGRDTPRPTAFQAPPSSIVRMDSSEHRRLRRLVAQAFSPRRVEMLRPRVQQIVDDLLDAMLVAGPPADLAASLTWPLPITIICDLLGVPPGDRDQFLATTDGIMAPSAAGNIEQHVRDYNNYMVGLIARRRTEPSDDLLGMLVHAKDDGDRLTEQEMIGFGADLLFAGHETTANQTGNFFYTLLADRHYWNELVADPDLVPAAIEELLRITPFAASADSPNIAVENLEVNGRCIKAGDAVVTVLASANRDAEVFENPDEIDFHRTTNPHVAFGHGIHYCLGAQLARIEMQTAIATVIHRLPGLRLAVPADQVSWRTNRFLRGVTALPVTWDSTH
ncbi:cytochrome P450 [Nocardia colli]|uniref:Cytochrome P450 n=1 Tax=Nocardia colli TaxID=2545717 RepID=A0A5N0DU66_9NOCA|nr:cytochrome P450 [Nocardia colli]KAA8880647.1 cytochrome P450 [Nocardia colli]